MHIKIVGFKCHIDTSYDFEADSMILLKGESGVGKSTILQAIFWALYGSMRGIYNNSGHIKKCSVTLVINGITIYRQKKPELLRVTYDGKDYEDAVGQQILDQTFGNRILWKACSYVEQKERCSLLSGTAAERLALLNMLSFNMDDPKEYIEKIDNKLKEINKNFIELQATFTAELNIFIQQITLRPVTIQLSNEEIQSLQNNIIVNEGDLPKLYQEVLSHERNIGSYNMLQSQITMYNDQLKSLEAIPPPDLTQLDIIVNNINNIKGLMDGTTKHKKLKSQKNAIINNIKTYEQAVVKYNNDINQCNLIIQRLDPPTIHVTNEMIWENTEKEKQKSYQMKECEMLGCLYDQTSINTMVATLQTEINENNRISSNLVIYNQYEKLRSQYTAISTTCQGDPSKEYISELEAKQNAINLELQEMRNGLNLLLCPNCTKSLRYINNKLVLGETEPVSNEQIRAKELELKSIISQINNLRNMIQIKNQLDNLSLQLSNIDPSELVLKDTRNHQAIINRLIRIQIINIPYTTEYLKSVLDYANAIKNLEQLTRYRDTKLNDIKLLNDQLNNILLPDSIIDDTLPSKLSTYEYQLKQLQQQQTDHNNRLNNISHIKSTINQLTTQKNSIILKYDASSLYETSKNTLNSDKLKLDDALYSQKIIQNQNKLEIQRSDVMILNNDMVALQHLKQNSINIEHKQLQDTVDTINYALNDILPLFFTDPIEMELRLYKELKTKKEIKPGLNIYIKHRGTEYDNINQLSGGEADRISLGLILALNKVSNSPVILLDECISSLDGSLKESCISAMKQLRNKTIICVDHEAVEGYYDTTIKVKT